MKQKKIIYLSAPSLADYNIKKKITCIRGHRKRIFNISTEYYTNKIIFHNYGHGGAGWTFLFGCVNASIKQFEHIIAQNPTLKKKPIYVIGAGCYGLLTALHLAQKDYPVTIIADQLTQLASTQAVGFFFPRPRTCATTHERAIFYNMALSSYTSYLSILRGEHPFIQHGPRLLPAYFSPTIDPGYQPFIDAQLIEPPTTCSITFGRNALYQVNAYKLIYINPAVIFNELQYAVQKIGIPHQAKKLTTFDALPESIIFNCAGLGARELTQDRRMLPVQGHIITLQNQPPADREYLINVKVKQEATRRNQFGQNYTFLKDELLYFAPKGNGILGITFLRNQDGQHENYHEFDRLLVRARHFFGQD